MQQQLDPKTVAKARGDVSLRMPKGIYQVYLLGLMHLLLEEEGSWCPD